MRAAKLPHDFEEINVLSTSLKGYLSVGVKGITMIFQDQIEPRSTQTLPGQWHWHIIPIRKM